LIFLDCKYCNKELKDDDLFCSGCGEKISVKDKIDSTSASTINEANSINNRHRPIRIESNKNKEANKESVLFFKKLMITMFAVSGAVFLLVIILSKNSNEIAPTSSVMSEMMEEKFEEESEEEKQQREIEEEEARKKAEEQRMLANEEKFNSLVNIAKNASSNNNFSAAVKAMNDAMSLNHRYTEALELKNKYLELKTQQEKAIKKTQGVRLGMTKQDVRDSSWGKPKDINRTITEYMTYEQWVYDGYKYLYFEDGILTTIQD
jgi:hypothetical protein